MGSSDVDAWRNDKGSVATLERALDPGITFFDTADVYGPRIDEELEGGALKGNRECSRRERTLSRFRPGTKRRTYLIDTLTALDVQLTSADLNRVAEVAPRAAFPGPRYSDAMMRMVNR